MKTITVTVHEGENLGPIDPNWDWKAFAKQCGERDATSAWQAVLKLKPGDKVRSSHSECYWEVIQVGMYDGWPFWRPIPSYQCKGPLGTGDWHAFTWIRDVQPQRDWDKCTHGIAYSEPCQQCEDRKREATTPK